MNSCHLQVSFVQLPPFVLCWLATVLLSDCTVKSPVASTQSSCLKCHGILLTAMSRIGCEQNRLWTECAVSRMNCEQNGLWAEWAVSSMISLKVWWEKSMPKCLYFLSRWMMWVLFVVYEKHQWPVWLLHSLAATEGALTSSLQPTRNWCTVYLMKRCTSFPQWQTEFKFWHWTRTDSYLPYNFCEVS